MKTIFGDKYKTNYYPNKFANLVLILVNNPSSTQIQKCTKFGGVIIDQVKSDPNLLNLTTTLPRNVSAIEVIREIANIFKNLSFCPTGSSVGKVSAQARSFLQITCYDSVDLARCLQVASKIMLEQAILEFVPAWNSLVIGNFIQVAGFNMERRDIIPQIIETTGVKIDHTESAIRDINKRVKTLETKATATKVVMSRMVEILEEQNNNHQQNTTQKRQNMDLTGAEKSPKKQKGDQ